MVSLLSTLQHLLPLDPHSLRRLHTIFYFFSTCLTSNQTTLRYTPLPTSSQFTKVKFTLPQLGVLDRLLEREALRVERDETVAQRPPVDRLVQYDLLPDHHHPDVLELLQPGQDLLHRFRLRLFRHRADRHHHLLARGGRIVRVEAIGRIEITLK